MEGDAPNCTPWHQLEAAKLLHKLGLGNTPTTNIMPPLPHQSVIPAQSLPPSEGRGGNPGRGGCGR